MLLITLHLLNNLTEMKGMMNSSNVVSVQENVSVEVYPFLFLDNTTFFLIL